MHEEPLPADAPLFEVRKIAEREVHVAGFERGLHVLVHHLLVAQAASGRVPGKIGAQPGQEVQLADIDQRDDELPARGGRVEGGAAQHRRIDAGKRRLGRRHQLAAARRRQHAGRRAHEEDISYRLAQARKRRAGRRLAEVQFFRRLRNASRAVQHHEQPQQVEVEAARYLRHKWSL